MTTWICLKNMSIVHINKITLKEVLFQTVELQTNTSCKFLPKLKLWTHIPCINIPDTLVVWGILHSQADCRLTQTLCQWCIQVVQDFGSQSGNCKMGPGLFLCSNAFCNTDDNQLSSIMTHVLSACDQGTQIRCQYHCLSLYSLLVVSNEIVQYILAEVQVHVEARQTVTLVAYNYPYSYNCACCLSVDVLNMQIVFLCRFPCPIFICGFSRTLSFGLLLKFCVGGHFIFPRTEQGGVCLIHTQWLQVKCSLEDAIYEILSNLCCCV